MTEIQAPRAERRPFKMELHGDVRLDEFYWLKERENKEVIDYLDRENEYYRQKTAHTHKLQEHLYREMKGRIREDDSSVPYKLNGYWYSTRYETGKEYPVYSRRKESLQAPEELLFNCNLLAESHEYFDLTGISVSPDNRLAAYGTDTVSRRQYRIQIKDLSTGQIFPEVLENTSGGSVWASDNKTLYYAKNDPQTLRSDKIYRHRLGTKSEEDELVYHEKDEAFNTYVYKTKSKKYIIIGSQSILSSEFRILKAGDPSGEFVLFTPRVGGVEYTLYHYGRQFYILTNKDGAMNFKLMRAKEENTRMEQWEEFIPHREEVLLEDLDIFRDYYVISERTNGLNQLKVVRWDGTESYYLPFENETYIAYTYVNPDFETDTLRYVYNAMSSPYAIIDLNMHSRELEVKKEQEVLGGAFRKENYRSERVWARARDGARVAISLVYHKDTPRNAKTPLLLYGYGAYGSTSDPYFSSLRLSLLDRGFIYAIAHVRGGEYLGRAWYENGKLLHKKNTFTDFIDCTTYLISQNFTAADHMYAYGGSAGGLLMGAIVNMAPELYHGIIAAVPFVDVVTTMLDESIPLTTGEYDEWGNPNEKIYYDYMKSYSPYDNVRPGEFPNLLVTAGLHDSQVQYWEPAKWVAKMRTVKKGDKLLFLETNMEAGHGGASGRFEAIRETAREFAFLLDLEGKTD